jgi:hypothetical protein
MSEQLRLFGDSNLLGRDAPSLEECFKQSAVGGVLQTVCCRGSASSSLLFFDCLSLQVEGNTILRKAGTNDTTTRRHFPEGSNPCQYRCENLKYRNVYLQISINDTFEVESLRQQQTLK